VNQLVRQAVIAWCNAGAYVVHLTGDKDPDANSLQHPQYIVLPFYENMAGLLGRANLAISRSGAGSLAELAVCGTPAILIPYPFAAEDHQSYNAAVFTKAGAALTFQQSKLTAMVLQNQVLELLKSPTTLQEMSHSAKAIAVVDSAEQLAELVRQIFSSNHTQTKSSEKREIFH
jgi:UDP-N-acetylglucosamine--N-acetylmuramyl-(pentapeptide) pyrophosphoryl-undecaprenol N-acetylglucosamine transferase